MARRISSLAVALARAGRTPRMQHSIGCFQWRRQASAAPPAMRAYSHRVYARSPQCFKGEDEARERGQASNEESAEVQEPTGAAEEAGNGSDEGAAAGSAEGEGTDGEEGGEVEGGNTENGQSDLDALRKERDDLKEALLRALADQDNTRRIAARDVENARTFGVEKFAKALLPVNDNLKRALDAVPEAELTDDNHMLKELHLGVKMTQTLLEKALATQKVVEFCEAGEAFDPARHSAMFTVPNDGSMEPNSIAQVVETGYMIHDRVLRDAKVGVVEKGAPAAAAGE